MGSKFRGRRRQSSTKPRRTFKTNLSLETLEQRQLLAADVLFRVNAGGSQLAGNPPWTTDSAFTNTGAAGSKTHSTSAGIDLSHASIPTGTPEDLFKKERWDASSGQEMQWDFAVTPGTYEVRLYFAEIYSGAFGVGKRVFDVAIEGATVLDNYDVFADVGGNKAVMKSFVVNSDSNIDIDFDHVTQNPAIKGIEILQTAVGNQLTSSQSNVDFTGVLVGNTVAQNITLTNLGSAGDPSITINPSSLSLVGSDASQFTASFGSASAIVLAPGETANLNITFQAADASSKQAQLLLPHTGDNSPLTINLTGTGVTDVPINFDKSDLDGEISSRPTSLQFGPDNRLYVAQQDGLINVYSVDRFGVGDYSVVATETIDLIQQIPNHNDDGTLNPDVDERLVLGIYVTGTAQNPVLYVTSSDPRIGAGGSGADVNLDTNSGVLSRLTWNGSSWDKIDLVRGLPRSEENHASNGIALDESTNTLYIAQGGNTNMGAPSNNFAYLPEFALSAAILSVDLDAIGDTTYDLPTLDDEDQPGADTTDPFGGNDGLNQAVLVPGGPVQVYAPGFRNPFDVLLTQDGRLYSIDNGPNAGWGGTPNGEGPEGNATNDSKNGGATYGDGLHFITGPGYYAGHPNPTRSNTDNTFNDTNPQAAVSTGNAVESDYRKPGSENGALHVWGSSTNGLTEYTASNFQGALRGDILAASFNNSIKRVKTNAAGDTAVLEEQLFSSVGSIPIDVTALGDDGPFPGTIWVAVLGSGKITVFEPADYGGVVVDPNNSDDTDGDGYLNDDEIANGTSPTNAADTPPDWDQDFTSNLLDVDDDNDGLLDTADPFAIDPDNGLTTEVGVSYDWENEGEDIGGLIRAGFTGLMTNGIDDYEALFDPGALTSGGAAGVLTLDGIGEGDATGNLNTQQQAFQFGVNVADATTPVTAHTRILAPFASETPQGSQSMGLFIGTGDQDNYLKIVIDASGISTQLEVAGDASQLASTNVTLPGPTAIDLYLTIDVQQSLVQASYMVDDGQRIDLGAPVAVPASWLTSTTQGMAAGIISTSVGSAPAIPATWDLIEVVAESASNLPPQLDFIANQTITAGESVAVDIAAFDPNGDNITLSTNALPTWITLQDGGDGTGQLIFAPTANDVGSLNVTLTATDDGTPQLFDSQTFAVTVNPAVVTGATVYRVNAGGGTVADDPAWTSDAGFTNSSAAVSYSYSNSANIDMSHESIPAGTPSALFKTERWDSTGGQEMQWDFDVTPGLYEVRLYFAETFGPTQGVGKRVFDVLIEGDLVLDNHDTYAEVGSDTALMKSFVVSSDGNLDIDFDHVTQNPQVRAIEIITAGSNANELYLSDSLMAFGEVTTGQSSTLQVTLTNQGVAGDPNITINTADLQLSGTGAGQFEVLTTGVLNLAPQQSASLAVRFTPSGVGTASANLTLAHSGDNSPLAIALSGTGKAPVATTASVFVEIDSGGSLHTSSTYSNGSFKVTNNSPDGQLIESVRLDIDTSFLPDVVFDPFGTAGDPVGKGFSANGGASATGVDDHFFAKPKHTGFQALEIAFDDFEPGETFTFSADIDPSSIRGASQPGPEDSGSVSGMELSGSLITITFNDGSTLTAELFRELGSDTGGTVTVEDGAPAAPQIQLLGLGSTPVVTADANQVARLTAAPGTVIRLMHAEAALHLSGVPNGGFDIDPFESNKVIELSETTHTVGAAGFVDVPVTLLNTDDEGGLNHLLAVAVSGDLTSDLARVLVEYDPSSANVAPVLNTIADRTVTAGDTQSFTISAIDPNADGLSFNVSNLPSYVNFTDNGNGTATLVVSPQVSDIGSDTLVVTVTDDGTPTLSDSQAFTITVQEEIIVDPNIDNILYRVNAGGGQVAGEPAWTTDSGLHNGGQSGSNMYSNSNSINTSHISLPQGTPESIFKSERYDPSNGQEMQWDFAVDPGAYEVRLYFAEIYSGAQGVGKRVFDVSIEGNLVLDNYDIYADVGGYTGVMKSFVVQADGNIDIDFDHVTQNPAIKGIEIVSAATPTAFFLN